MHRNIEEYLECEYEEGRIYLPFLSTVMRDMENPLERYTDRELIMRYRFSRDTIQGVILPIVYNLNVSGNRGQPVPPVIKLCVALRYYACGSFQRECGDLMRISQSSVSRIIKEVSEVLARNVGKLIVFPTEEQLLENMITFYGLCSFPRVIGAIDGTHIEIKSPGGPTAVHFMNRKGWISLNVQGTVGPNCCFLNIIIRWPGATHDSHIFSNCFLKRRLESGEVQGLLLGDRAYRQTNYLFTPVKNPQTNGERQYNIAHARGRHIVERAFGQWKQRFRCIQGCLQYALPMNLRIIAATAVLHNIATKREEFIPDPMYIPRDVPVAPTAENRQGALIRAKFIEQHFNSN